MWIFSVKVFLENTNYTLHVHVFQILNYHFIIFLYLSPQGYEGTMSSTSTMRSHAVGSVASLDSLKSTDPFGKSPRLSRRQSTKDDLPDGPSKCTCIVLETQTFCTQNRVQILKPCFICITNSVMFL